MATITAGALLMRWEIVSAALMFLASSLNVRFRRADYRTLAWVSSGFGIAASCWFAMGLIGLTAGDFPAIWEAFKELLIKIASHTPPEWPLVLP